MRNVSILKYVIFGLQSALNQIKGIIDYKGEELCHERCHEEGPCNIVGFAKPFTKLNLKQLIKRKVNKSTSNRSIKASRESF